MKKLLVITGMMGLFFSCGTFATSVGIVFDDSIPAEQTAQFFTFNIGKVTEYNGIPVNWEPNVSSMKTVQIPAGDTVLVWDIRAGQGNIIYTGKNMVFRYNFQPQKKYFLMFRRVYDENEKNEIYGLRVYTYEIDEKYGGTWDDVEAHFTEFVPFLNTQGSQKTVLE
jgi:hypothetical protein